PSFSVSINPLIVEIVSFCKLIQRIRTSPRNGRLLRARFRRDSCETRTPSLAFRMNKQGKDLTREAPRSPKTRLGDYIILARTLDKCRALLWGNIGEYH